MPPHRAKNKEALPAWPPVLSFPTVRPRQNSPAEVRAMFHIVYASSALQPFTKPELHVLLEQSRQKSAKLGVTGMLLYKDGNFMQVLEGEKEAVTKLAGKIEHDPRHKGFLILLRGTSEERLFPDWTMGFRDLADHNAAKTPGHTDFMNTQLTGAEYSSDPDRCMKLLLLVKNM
jgi:hypothetical protein